MYDQHPPLPISQRTKTILRVLGTVAGIALFVTVTSLLGSKSNRSNTRG